MSQESPRANGHQVSDRGSGCPAVAEGATVDDPV